MGKKLTHEEFEKKLKNIHGDEIVCLDKYINSRTQIPFKHTICEYIWEAKPNSILQGRSCPKCAGNIKKSHETFLRELKEVHNGEIECLGEYINDVTKIPFKRTVCGHMWKAIPYSVLRGHSCPKCNQSKGEKYIQKYLEKYNINFKSQYKITECKNIQPLPFDFGVFDNNDNLLFLLEHDGRQHFKPIDVFGGEEQFQRQQLHDTIKNNYCKTNNIPLERIAYNDWKNKEDLEKIIVQLLEKHNLIHINVKGVNHG